jgi:hypothetical protein
LVQSKVFASSSASSSCSFATVKFVAIENTIAGTSFAVETAQWIVAVPLRSTETQWALAVVDWKLRMNIAPSGHKFEF